MILLSQRSSLFLCLGTTIIFASDTVPACLGQIVIPCASLHPIPSLAYSVDRPHAECSAVHACLGSGCINHSGQRTTFRGQSPFVVSKLSTAADSEARLFNLLNKKVKFVLRIKTATLKRLSKSLTLPTTATLDPSNGLLTFQGDLQEFLAFLGQCWKQLSPPPPPPPVKTKAP